MIAAMKLSDKNNCTSAGYHAPVMSQEVLEAYAPAEGRLVVDCTLGGGGHSELLLEAGASVIGIDQDPEAIAFASNRLARFGDRFRAVRANFSQVGQVLGGFGLASADGFLLDLGVSSHQLDTPERGFSFRFDGPLDMRMSPELTVTAADWVNTASSEQLERMFREYGEEPQARRIAPRSPHRSKPLWQEPYHGTGPCGCRPKRSPLPQDHPLEAQCPSDQRRLRSSLPPPLSPRLPPAPAHDPADPTAPSCHPAPHRECQCCRESASPHVVHTCAPRTPAHPAKSPCA